MKLTLYSSKQYDRQYFELINQTFNYSLEFFDFKFSSKTASVAKNADAVCIFVNDQADRAALEILAQQQIFTLALRCAGFNNVDLVAAKALGIRVVRVPTYSPEAVAEHTVGLMLCLNRHIHRAYQRTRDANFSLDGLIGYNLHGKTVGVIGTGGIGMATLRILNGFGMRLLAHDPFPDRAALALGVQYVDLATLYSQSDVITLHCPLNADNHHLLNQAAFDQMKDGVMIINTSRGGLIDSQAAITALKQEKIGALGMDVYENESELFFQDNSNRIVLDDVFHRLSAFNNVLFTGHQAFLTREAMTNIAETTLTNIQTLQRGQICPNQIG